MHRLSSTAVPNHGLISAADGLKGVDDWHMDPFFMVAQLCFQYKCKGWCASECSLVKSKDAACSYYAVQGISYGKGVRVWADAKLCSPQSYG